MSRKDSLQEDICKKLDDIDGLTQALKDAKKDLVELIKEYRKLDENQTLIEGE